LIHEFGKLALIIKARKKMYNLKGVKNRGPKDWSGDFGKIHPPIFHAITLAYAHVEGCSISAARKTVARLYRPDLPAGGKGEVKIAKQMKNMNEKPPKKWLSEFNHWNELGGEEIFQQLGRWKPKPEETRIAAPRAGIA
jgi:hypothetical protein